MASVTLPVVVDENLVEFTTTFGTRTLTKILQQLSHNASVNAKVIVSIQNSIEEIRNSISHDQEGLQKKIEQERTDRRALEQQVNQQARRIEALEANCVRRVELDQQVTTLQSTIDRAIRFIEEIENGSGDRVTKFVSSYIEAFVPKWYSGVAQEMLDKVRSLVKDCSDDAAQNLDRRANECEEKAEQDLRKTHSNVVRSLHNYNEERRKEIAKVRTEIFERFGETDSRMDQLIAQSKFVQEKRHRATRQRLQSVEESACAMRTTLCLEDALCRELHNLMVAHTYAVDDPIATTARVDAEAAVIRDEKDVDSNLPGEQRGRDRHELFLPLSADDAVRDTRVRRVAPTPHFVAMRTLLQKEFSERMDYLKTDLHNDLVAEIFDLQRELRGKVGTNKLGELLDQYRDEGLYNNVRGLIQDMTEIKINKVDMVLFVEGLRSKADLRAIDAKVDKSVIGAQVDGLERKVEEILGAANRTEHRVMRMENQMSVQRNSTTASAPVRTQRQQDESGSLVLYERRETATSSPRGKLIKGAASRRQSAGGTRRRSMSPVSDDADTSDARGTSAGGRDKSAQEAVDQMLERQFPAQVVVHETRDISKLHHAVVKESHQRQVTAMVDDPDVEQLPSIAVNRGLPSSAVPHSASPRKTLTTPLASTARQRSAHSATVMISSTLSTSRGPGLIPLTKNQEAYCKTLEQDPPPHTGLGFAIGMMEGETRDY